MTDSRRILTAVAVALTLELVAGLLWVGAAAQRIALLEARLSTLSALEVRAARLEEQTAHLRTAVARMETKLDQALREEPRP